MMHCNDRRSSAPTRVAFPALVVGTALQAVVLLLAVPGDLLAAGPGGGGDLFSINPGLSIWTVVIFFILLSILWKFAWGPILGAAEAREQRIQGALDESAQKQAEAQRLLEEHKQQLAEARRHAQEIIAEGKAAGEKVRRDIEDKAREEGQALLERAKREIEREKDSALAELRRESVDLAMAAAAKLMHQKVDSEQDRRLVTGYVENLTAAETSSGGAAGTPSASRSGAEA